MDVLQRFVRLWSFSVEQLFLYQNELRVFEEQATPTLQFARDLIAHNVIVFRGGDKALQMLPRLVDIIPEARLNLIIYYLKQANASEICAIRKASRNTLR